MRSTYVKTSNYERFASAISAVQCSAAPEARWVLVGGEPGYGRSCTVQRWAAQAGAIYLYGRPEWTLPFFRAELCAKLKIDPTGGTHAVIGRLIGAIGRLQAPIVIDEVQHALADKAAILESLKGITELTETIAVLVAGEERVQPRIARYKQISSRIAEIVDFRAASLDDVALLCRELAEVEFAPDLVAEIHRQSAGRNREVVKAIGRVEALARRNKAASVSLADFAGQVLVNDWTSLRQSVVRGAR